MSAGEGVGHLRQMTGEQYVRDGDGAISDGLLEAAGLLRLAALMNHSPSKFVNLVEFSQVQLACSNREIGEVR